MQHEWLERVTIESRWPITGAPMENITRHLVLAELVVEVRESKKTEIKMPEHIEMCV